MRWLSRLSVVLILCLIAIALPAVPAQAVCVPYGIELSPKSGLPGTEVTVAGHDFNKDTLVDIYYDGTRVVTGRTDSSGDFTLLFPVPEDCTGPYKVEADLGQNELGQKIRVYKYFTVRPGLTVSPEKGPAGTNVTVRGQGFAQSEEDIELMYYLDGSYKTIESNISANATGSWEMSFPIPPSTRGEHKIDAQGAVSRIYEVKEAIFRVTAEVSTDTSSGIVGENVTMTGSRFASNERGIQLLLAGQAMVTGINANSQGEWEASFKVPEMPAGTYNVTAEGVYTKQEDLSSALSFEIKPDIVLSPDEGYVGIDLTVAGHGFAANEDVDIMYDGNQEKTAETDATGSFDNVSFSVPESQHGARPVTAKDAAENEATAIFIMESDPPPMPSLISPRDGGRVGLLNKVRPTFKWSAVSDDSGVHYRLQIATSANVTATGEFPEPIVSVTSLNETSYTATDALPNGTYYWIVQAVDKAGNAGDWTAARSFRAGLLPMWGFIAIIVAIAMLLGALIRALVIRRRYNY
jgi:hypothetical protein